MELPYLYAVNPNITRLIKEKKRSLITTWKAPIKHHSMSAVNDNANELCNEPSQFSFNLSEIEEDTNSLRERSALGSKRNEHPSSLNGGLNPSSKTCDLESK